MNLLHGGGKYANVIEHMYDRALSDVSLSWNKYLYVNPLETDRIYHMDEQYIYSSYPAQIARFNTSVANKEYS